MNYQDNTGAPKRRRFSTHFVGWMLWAAAATACTSSAQVSAQSPSSSATATPAPEDPSATEEVDSDTSSIARFREPLSPYGRWVDDPTYGTVWIPGTDAVGADFVPYQTGGHWGLTADDQWIWVSDYNWGWAPFHYGRWVWIDGTGWAWIAGGVYAPAWVVWQTGYYDEAYVGWAPMPPAWYWRGGVAVRVAVGVSPRYVFVPSRHVFMPGLRAYVVPTARVSVIAPHMQAYGVARAGARYPALAMARGPTPAVARVPATAVPKERVARDPRAAPASHAAPAPRAAENKAAPGRPAGDVRGGGPGGGRGGGRGRGGGHRGR